MLFYPSDSIEHIKCNIFILHCIVISCAGLILLTLFPLYTKDAVVSIHIGTGLFMLALGVISLITILKRKKIMIPINIVLMGIVLMVLYFKSRDVTGANPVVLSGFISFIPLLNIFYGRKATFWFTAAFIAIMFLRMAMIEFEWVHLPKSNNPGWLDILLFSLFITYITLVFGYYSTQIKGYFRRVRYHQLMLERTLKKSERTNKDLNILMKEFQCVSDEHIEGLQELIHGSKKAVENAHLLDHKVLLEKGSDISSRIDDVLIQINNRIEGIERIK